jgi:hypothetical protein
MENEKYYIVSENYVGPNVDQNLNSHCVRITTTPPRTNMSREIRTSGWLGTTNDWAKYAHGEFNTIEEAREAREFRDNLIEKVKNREELQS